MAKGSIQILKDKIDVPKLVEQLNAALSEEWLAYYQYWVGALVVRGPQRAAIQDELNEHAQEELRHANMLAARIIELDGTPVLDPNNWFNMARCKYDAPNDNGTMKILEQNIAGERCAIARYQNIASMTHGIDFTTCDMVKQILREEEEHEQDLQDFVDDLTHAKEYFNHKTTATVKA